MKLEYIPENDGTAPRDLLKEVAANIQVIVFTCRPEDYLPPKAGKNRLGDKVRSVDLSQFVERAGAP